MHSKIILKIYYTATRLPVFNSRAKKFIYINSSESRRQIRLIYSSYHQIYIYILMGAIVCATEYMQLSSVWCTRVEYAIQIVCMPFLHTIRMCLFIFQLFNLIYLLNSEKCEATCIPRTHNSRRRRRRQYESDVNSDLTFHNLPVFFNLCDNVVPLLAKPVSVTDRSPLGWWPLNWVSVLVFFRFSETENGVCFQWKALEWNIMNNWIFAK